SPWARRRALQSRETPCRTPRPQRPLPPRDAVAPKVRCWREPFRSSFHSSSWSERSGVHARCSASGATPGRAAVHGGNCELGARVDALFPIEGPAPLLHGLHNVDLCIDVLDAVVVHWNHLSSRSPIRAIAACPSGVCGAALGKLWNAPSVTCTDASTPAASAR